MFAKVILLRILKSFFWRGLSLLKPIGNIVWLGSILWTIGGLFGTGPDNFKLMGVITQYQSARLAYLVCMMSLMLFPTCMMILRWSKKFEFLKLPLGILFLITFGGSCSMITKIYYEKKDLINIGKATNVIEEKEKENKELETEKEILTEKRNKNYQVDIVAEGELLVKTGWLYFTLWRGFIMKNIVKKLNEPDDNEYI